MKLRVRVQPNARKVRVEKLSDGLLKVYVNAPPIDGKANVAVIGALAEHFRVSKSRVRILSGLAGRDKLVEVND